MATDTYSNYSIFADGNLLAEAQSIDADWDTALQVVKTMGKGFAGANKGSEQMNISVESAIPSTGLEFDPLERMKELGTFELTIANNSTGKSLTSTGFLQTAKLSQATDSQAKFNFAFVGEWSVFE